MKNNKSSQRTYWVNKAINEIKKSRIVIIEGLRRIGKSLVQETVMNDQYFDEYTKIYIKVGIFGQDDHQNITDIFNLIKANPKNKYALFIDEFQDYKEWSRLFFSLYDFENVKVLATGSVSAMVDGVRITEGGRFRYITMHPLSYKEFTEISNTVIGDDSFNKYATTGSYPDQEYTDNLIKYKEQVFENIIEKIKNQRLLEVYRIESSQTVTAILLYIIENIGQTISINSVSEKLGVKEVVVEKIINYLKQTFIIYEIANSFLGKGKAAMNNRKYYLTDHTFYLFVKQSMFTDITTEYADSIFENIIFNNIRSSFERREVEIRFEIDKKSKIDYDLVIIKDDKKHYFEIKNSLYGELSKNQASTISTIGGSIVYLGPTIIRKDVQYINYIDFILDVKKWV